MNIRDSVRSILSDKKAKQQGLHVKHIARHILNMNSNLFNHAENPGYEALKAKVNRMLLYDIKKKKGSLFARVVNPKTNKHRKGWYRLKR
jgi:hypothetical protein